MRVACFTLVHWKNADDAQFKSAEIQGWSSLVDRILQPDVKYVACGTYSDPALCPIQCPVVNSGVEYTRGHDVRYWGYSFPAETAGLWHFILNTNCDVVMQMATDTVTKVNVRECAEKLMASDKLICAPSWAGVVEDAIIIYKRQGVVKFLNQRLRANLVEREKATEEPMLAEQEKARIFDGQWLNLWPERQTMRQEWGIPDRSPFPDELVITENWPFVLRPSPEIRKRYE